ncbi:MAG: hypothetical protein K8U57_27800 [Planctomycetes bacterium]|nr:hypothetical protein [Planctomycetota bacterium]
MNDTPQQPKKPAMSLCIAKSGQVIARSLPAGEKPRNVLHIPLNVNADPRLFVKGGELVRPFVTYEFKLRRTMDVSGIDVSLYQEAGMKEFDPADMVPIAIRSLDKDFDELNGA